MLKQTNVPIMNKAVNLIYDMSEDSKFVKWQDCVKRLFMTRLRANAKNEAELRKEKNLLKNGVKKACQMKRSKNF